MNKHYDYFNSSLYIKTLPCPYSASFGRPDSFRFQSLKNDARKKSGKRVSPSLAMRPTNEGRKNRWKFVGQLELRDTHLATNCVGGLLSRILIATMAWAFIIPYNTVRALCGRLFCSAKCSTFLPAATTFPRSRLESRLTASRTERGCLCQRSDFYCERKCPRFRVPIVFRPRPSNPTVLSLSSRVLTDNSLFLFTYCTGHARGSRAH